MTDVSADVRSAVRSLLKARGFTSIAVVTLGTGLASCITVLAVVNACLIRPLPYPASDRLYSVELAAPGESPPGGLTAIDWSALDDLVEHRIAWDLGVFFLLGGSHPESAPGAWVTPGFLEAMGVRAALGRSITREDFRPGRPPPALIGDGLWRRRFGADPAIAGRTITAYVSDRPEQPELLTVAGVLPADFWHINPYTDVIAPLRGASYPYMVRLRAGVPPEVVAERISAVVRRGALSVPSEWRARLTSVQAGYTAEARPPLVAVAGAAALVLLVACVSVTESRAARRTRSALIALELAGSLTLLGGAALMIESTLRMLRVDFGFRADEVLSSSIGLRQRTYPDPASRAVFFERLLRRLADAPDAPRAALGDWWPLQETRLRRIEAAGEGGATAVSAAYFETLGLEVGEGETFSVSQDRPGGEAVVVVSASLAKQLWPRGGAVGRTVRIAGDGDHGSTALPARHRVVGVVDDVRQAHADQDLRDAYVPLLQRPGRFAFVYLRGVAPAGAEARLRRAVAGSTRRRPWGRRACSSRSSIASGPGAGCWRGSCQDSPDSPGCWRSSASTASSPTRFASASARSASEWRSAPSAGP